MLKIRVNTAQAHHMLDKLPNYVVTLVDGKLVILEGCCIPQIEPRQVIRYRSYN